MRIKIGKVCVGKLCRGVPFSPNKQMHWGTRMRWKDAWSEIIWWEIRANYPQIKIRDYAILIIYLYTTRPQDYDNSVASVKPIIDALKGVILIDDDPTHCEVKVVTKKVSHREDEHIEIEIL
jgi:Holliday junction resolvase RusA-like endonuclease